MASPHQLGHEEIKDEDRNRAGVWYRSSIKLCHLPAIDLHIRCCLGDIHRTHSALEMLANDVLTFSTVHIADVFQECFDGQLENAGAKIATMCTFLSVYLRLFTTTPTRTPNPTARETLLGIIQSDSYSRLSLARAGKQLVALAETVRICSQYDMITTSGNCIQLTSNNQPTVPHFRHLVGYLGRAGISILLSALLQKPLEWAADRLAEYAGNALDYSQTERRQLRHSTEATTKFPDLPTDLRMPYAIVGRIDALNGPIFVSSLQKLYEVVSQLGAWTSEAANLMRHKCLATAYAHLACTGMRVLNIIDERFMIAVRDYNNGVANPEALDHRFNPETTYPFDTHSSEVKLLRYCIIEQKIVAIKAACKTFIDEVNSLTKTRSQSSHPATHDTESPDPNVSEVMIWMRRLTTFVHDMISNVEKDDAKVVDLILSILPMCEAYSARPEPDSSSLHVVVDLYNRRVLTGNSLDHVLFEEDEASLSPFTH